MSARKASARDVGRDAARALPAPGAAPNASPADPPNDPAAGALAAVRDTYRLLDDHFDEVYAACRTDAARAELRALHASARDAYWKAVAGGLHDDNLVVQGIRRDLADANARIEGQLATLQEVGAVLRVLTEAVRLAGALVGLAAA